MKFNYFRKCSYALSILISVYGNAQCGKIRMVYNPNTIFYSSFSFSFNSLSVIQFDSNLNTTFLFFFPTANVGKCFISYFNLYFGLFSSHFFCAFFQRQKWNAKRHVNPITIISNIICVFKVTWQTHEE